MSNKIFIKFSFIILLFIIFPHFQHSFSQTYWNGNKLEYTANVGDEKNYIFSYIYEESFTILIFDDNGDRKNITINQDDLLRIVISSDESGSLKYFQYYNNISTEERYIQNFFLLQVPVPQNYTFWEEMVDYWKSWYEFYNSTAAVEFVKITEEFNITYTHKNEKNETQTIKRFYNINSGWAKRLETLTIKESKILSHFIIEENENTTLTNPTTEPTSISLESSLSTDSTYLKFISTIPGFSIIAIGFSIPFLGIFPLLKRRKYK
ncbi:MAG: hypothetical protein HeimC3_16520 [Candidatus Heimdallarchaeota archaeon LC_3]|nr:MAG: hypothetical protein HeimC3_16520 [Candidatus Heimdallarchaeota archaeon LC_3]